MNSIVKGGIAVAAGDNGTLTTATFESVRVIDPRNFVLASRDIGTPGQAGSISYANGIYTLSGGGSGIGGAADKFQFGANGLVGDWDLTSQILSTNVGSTAGIMIRNDDSADAVFAGILLGPDNTLNFTWRSSDGGAANSAAGPTVAGTAWVKMSRIGNSFTGWYSTDGTTWTQIGSAQSIAVAPSVLGGLAVTSNDDAALSHAVFANVSVSDAISFNGTANDVGNQAQSGTSYFTNGDSYVISGSGTAIGGETDEFHFSSNNFTGDGTIVAQVALPADAGAGAEAGVMYRNDGSADSRFAEVVLTSDNQVKFAWRDGSGSGSTVVALDNFQAGDSAVGQTDSR